MPEISLHIDGEFPTKDYPNPDLIALIEGCLANERSAQETLYKKYYGKMMGVCMRYIRNRDDAMAVLNHGFLKVFRSLGTYERSGSLDAWIYRIIYNSIIDSLRSKSKEVKTETIDQDYEPVYLDHGILQDLIADDLLKILDNLPESSRIVFNMFAIEGYKHEEISKILGISVGTSKWHVNSARQLLKTILEKQNRS